MTPETVSNRLIVEKAFRAWSAGDDFFNIMADNAQWTIMGSGPTARTHYGRQNYIDAAVTPLMTRLAEPVQPHVLDLWAVDDHVIVRWEQNTTARDGKPYKNSYAWFFRMSNGLIAEATAFLDLNAYDDLIARLP